jgi:hypothetical protein
MGYLAKIVVGQDQASNFHQFKFDAQRGIPQRPIFYHCPMFTGNVYMNV